MQRHVSKCAASEPAGESTAPSLLTMEPLHFLNLLAMVSSIAGTGAGAGVSAGAGARASPVAFHPNEAAPFKPIGPYYCSTTGNYTFKSPYQVNLIKLMDALQSGAIANRAGFNYAVAGEAPDAKFGLTMCYADRSLTQCKDCHCQKNWHLYWAGTPVSTGLRPVLSHWY